VPQKRGNKRTIFLTASHKLCHRQVMHFQTQATSVSGVSITDFDQTLLPICGKNGSFRGDTMRIVAKRLVKWRAFAN